MVTQQLDATEEASLRRLLPRQADVVQIDNLPHPFFLPWYHFNIFREDLAKSDSTHFLYLEDDLLFGTQQWNYWLESYQLLRPHGLLPGFVRVERNNADQKLYCTDSVSQVWLEDLQCIKSDYNRWFVETPSPYQAMYLLDRDLLNEHLSGPSSHPDYSHLHTREAAAQGLAFHNKPPGFTSRCMLGYFPQQARLDPCCMVEHMSANYANDPASKHGKIYFDTLVQSRGTGFSALWRKQFAPRLTRFHFAI